MAEQFNVDLPPPFRYKEKEQEKKDREVEEYLSRLSRAIEEMMKRLFNRLSA